MRKRCDRGETMLLHLPGFVVGNSNSLNYILWPHDQSLGNVNVGTAHCQYGRILVWLQLQWFITTTPGIMHLICLGSVGLLSGSAIFFNKYEEIKRSLASLGGSFTFEMKMDPNLLINRKAWRQEAGPILRWRKGKKDQPKWSILRNVPCQEKNWQPQLLSYFHQARYVSHK